MQTPVSSKSLGRRGKGSMTLELPLEELLSIFREFAENFPQDL
jgi:hypothetical protein